MALKNSQRTYNHMLLHELREKGELDTQVYGRIKEEKELVKKQDVIPKAFPVVVEKIKYPEHALKLGNPLYVTSNMQYGSQQPSVADLPAKYFPRPEAFTDQFLGGQFKDTGLNTTKTPSRVHATLDL